MSKGKGTDKRGGSRSKLVLDYRLAEVPGGTRVDVDADIQLVGPIAQFGRTGIVTETANILIRQFVQNVEAKLAAMPAHRRGERRPRRRAPAARLPRRVSICIGIVRGEAAPAPATRSAPSASSAR